MYEDPSTVWRCVRRAEGHANPRKATPHLIRAQTDSEAYARMFCEYPNDVFELTPAPTGCTKKEAEAWMRLALSRAFFVERVWV